MEVTRALASALQAQAETLSAQTMEIRQRIEAQDIVLRRLVRQVEGDE